jgi:hypothetical protein
VGKAIRDIVFQAWGLGGITYLVLTKAVEGKLALGVFAVAAGITSLPAFLRAREAGKEAEKVASG